MTYGLELFYYSKAVPCIKNDTVAAESFASSESSSLRRLSRGHGYGWENRWPHRRLSMVSCCNKYIICVPYILFTVSLLKGHIWSFSYAIKEGR